jgi:hypothetical protein
MAARESGGTDRRLWWAAAAIAVVALILGYIGSRSALPDGFQWTDPIYNTLALFVLNFNVAPSTRLNVPLDLARFLAPAATGLAGFTAVYTLFREQLREMRVRRWKDHVVVCGLGYKGFTFVQHLHEDQARVVVVEHDATNPTVDDCRALGVPVIIGDAQYDAILRKAGAKRAKWLIAVCNDDAVNTEILLSARTVVSGRRHGTLNCLAQINDSALCSLLRVSQIDRDDGTWTAGFFNTDDTAAALLLREHPIAAPGEEPPHHILVAHLDPLGRQLIVLAAQKWVSSSTQRAPARAVPLQVTVLDDEADEGVRKLQREHAVLRRACKFITASTSAADIEQLKVTYAERRWPNPSRGYVTASDDDQGVATTLRLMHHLQPPIKLVAALSRTYGTGNLLHSLPKVDVQVFPRFEMTCTPDLLIDVSVEQLAREIHEVWREEQRAANKADPTWGQSSDAYKESSKAQAHDIPAKMSYIGCSIRPLRDGAPSDFAFTDAEVELLADKEHDRWMSEHLISGWSFAVGDKNEVNRTSPYLVPFGDLPPEVAEWDRVFVRKIPQILHRAGLQVHRKKRGVAAVEGTRRLAAASVGAGKSRPTKESG